MTAPAEWVGVLEDLREIAAFLDGSAPFDGRWFGDEDVPLVAGKYPARYWWRKALRERVDAAIAALRAQQEPVEAPVAWAKRQMVVGAGCGVEGVLHIDGSVQDDEVPLYAQSTISKVSALLDVAMTTLRQIESTPRNAGARRNARATVRFIETLLAALYAAPPATPEPKR